MNGDSDNIRHYKYQTVTGAEEDDVKTLDVDVKISDANHQIDLKSDGAGTNWAFSLIAVFTGTLMAISDGMTYGWTSPMIPYFLSNETHINITKSDGEYMETIILFGGATGLPITILVIEYFGRKKSMLLSALIGCACWVILLVVNTLSWVFVARFFAGLAGGTCFVAAPMYIAEIAHPKVRGFLSASIYLMLLTGILIVYIAGSLAPYSVVPCIGIVLTACQLIFFPFMPESPYYFVYKNKHDRAKKALLRLRAGTNVSKEILEIKQAVERQKTGKGRPQDLILIRSNRYALLIVSILYISYHFVGFSVILMNVHIILGEASSIYIQPSTAAIMFASGLLVGACISSSLMDRFGRKFLLVISGISTGVALLIMTIYFHLKNLEYDVVHVSWIPAACVMIYAFTFKIGLGLVPIVMSAEIFPTAVKTIGMTIAIVVHGVAGIASISMYSALVDNFGIHVPFYIFSIWCFVSVILTIFVIPETKGKTLDEIQFLLKGNEQTRHKTEQITNGTELNNLA